MSVNPSPFGPCPQFEGTDGLPAVGDQLFFYVAGSVGTKQSTFTNSTGSVANSNPITLNSRGMPSTEIWFTDGLAYKVVWAPAGGSDPPTSPIRTWDNLTGINSTINSASEWVALELTPTYLSVSSFSVPGDQTSTLHVGRRIRATVSGGTRYGRITASTFGGGATTVTVTLDSSSLDAGLSAVSYGLLSATNPSVPQYPGQFTTLNATGAVSLARVNTTSGVSAVTPDLTPITLFALPGAGLFRVFAYLSNAGAQYIASAEVGHDGTNPQLVRADNGANMTITLSGSNVQGTQASGAGEPISWSYLRIL
jgi:hypothetical protein